MSSELSRAVINKQHARGQLVLRRPGLRLATEKGHKDRRSSPIMEAEMNVAYTAHATATGGREGHSRSDDGKDDVALTPPKELGGSGTGVNPEQLFAAGYAACYLGAIKFAAGKEKIKISDDAKVTAHVGIGERDDKEGFGLTVTL